MIRYSHWLLLVLLSAAACESIPRACGQEDRPVEDAAKFKLQVKANDRLPTLHLVGDSTMKVGTPGQRGWGEEMAGYFNLEKINVCNQAIGGRSSRTFQTEGRWAAVLSTVERGDIVIIEFGHNDGGAINEKPPVTPMTRARGTISGVGDEVVEIENILTGKHEVVHSYGWYIRKYVRDVKSRGAMPIVMSLVPRNRWKDGKVERSSANSHGVWARLVAEAEGCRFIDHNGIIANAMEEIGPERAGALFSDNLHATAAGAAFNARAAIAGLKSLPDNPLAGYFSDAAREVAPLFGSR